MSWVVEHLQKQIKEMVLRKRDIEIELHDLDETIKVLSSLTGTMVGRESIAANATTQTETDNPYPTAVYVE
jgi:hypothetical protein